MPRLPANAGEGLGTERAQHLLVECGELRKLGGLVAHVRDDTVGLAQQRLGLLWRRVHPFLLEFRRRRGRMDTPSRPAGPVRSRSQPLRRAPLHRQPGFELRPKLGQVGAVHEDEDRSTEVERARTPQHPAEHRPLVRRARTLRHAREVHPQPLEAQALCVDQNPAFFTVPLWMMSRCSHVHVLTDLRRYGVGATRWTGCGHRKMVTITRCVVGRRRWRLGGSVRVLRWSHFRHARYIIEKLGRSHQDKTVLGRQFAQNVGMYPFVLHVPQMVRERSDCFVLTEIVTQVPSYDFSRISTILAFQLPS